MQVTFTTFTTEQAPGAWTNGTRIMKVKKDEGDTHEVGAKATIVGSIGPVPIKGRQAYGYFVMWDDIPGMPVFVTDYKIGPVP